MSPRVVLVAAFVAVAACACALGGCFSLDSFVWNPRHCSIVDKKSSDCTDSHVCSTCDEPYDFTAFDIPADAVTQIPVAISGKQTLDTYFITSNGERPGVVVVYAHGNFGGLEHYLNRVGLLYKTGVNIYAIDYRGFGKSSTADEPSDEAVFDDDVHKTRDALDAAMQDAGVVDPLIVYYGYSAGALAAVEMGVYQQPDGLILESPWPSAQAFGDDSTFADIPQPFFSNGAWDDIARMPKIHAPLLQMHGSADDFVRFEVGKLVFDAANEPKQLIKVNGAGHGNGGQDVPTVLGDAYFTDVEQFIDGL